MKRRGVWRATAEGLKPVDEAARETFAALKAGQDVLAAVHRPRHIEHHNWFMAMLQKVAEAKGETQDYLLAQIKIALGLVDFIRMPSGKVVAALRSVSFESMDQAEFAEVSVAAVRLICEQILPGLEPSELTAEIDEMLGTRRAA